MALLWTITDQQAIKPISKNRTQDFTLIANEVQVNDLHDLLGYEFYQDITQNPTAEWNKKLIDGGTFQDVSGVTRTYAGLKYVLAYFFFARYIGQSDQFDTFAGVVKKDFDNSSRLGDGETKRRITEERSIAFSYWKECELFIMQNVSNFEFYKYGDNVSYRHLGDIEYL